MSQLDISISFSQLVGLLICFYFFIYYIISMVIKYWYNNKLRSLNEVELSREWVKIDNSLIIKRILKF